MSGLRDLDLSGCLTDVRIYGYGLFMEMEMYAQRLADLFEVHFSDGDGEGVLLLFTAYFGHRAQGK